jgi:hypothetical protein
MFSFQNGLLSRVDESHVPLEVNQLCSKQEHLAHFSP